MKTTLLYSGLLSMTLICEGRDFLFNSLIADKTIEEDLQNHTTIVENLNGILIVGDPKLVLLKGRQDIQGVQTEAIKLPGSKQKLERMLEPYLNQPLTKYNMVQIKKQIIDYYRDENRPVIHVQIPEQKISTGVLQIIVYESKLGEIRSVGNHHFSNKRLIGEMRLKPGDPINAEVLVEDLNWMNRNTFRQTDALFTPGTVSGTTDIELLTKDRRLWRLYAGTDNTGLDQTGQERWFGGINFGNFFNWDQQFTYQFTSATNYKDFSAHTFNWIIPLPWRDVLTFYGGYSNVHSGDLNITQQPGFKTRGQSMQASMRWDIPLPNWEDFLQEILTGADWKRTNNNVEFDGDIFFGKSANLFQLMAGYNLGYEDRKRKVSLTWENFFSPGQIMSDQSATVYNSLRLYAKPRYYYTRLTFNPIFRHVKTGVSLYLILRGQWANQNLLSSEQFGIGGYNTVRGYDERILNGDDAFVGNLEVRSPQWKVFWQKSGRDRFQFLFFYDYGKAWVHKTMPGEEKGKHIDSAGTGIRYIIDQYLTVRVDAGYGFVKIPHQKPRLKTHFGIVASY